MNLTRYLARRTQIDESGPERGSGPGGIHKIFGVALLFMAAVSGFFICFFWETLLSVLS